MQVSFISNSIQKSPAFKGLWGTPKIDAAVTTDSVYNHSEQFYYPFKDEQPEDIKNAIISRADSFSAGWEDSLGDTVYINATVNLMDTLPFSKDEYRKYKAGKYNNDEYVKERTLIENSLEENNLTKYKNSLPSNEKKSIKSFFKRIFKSE